MKLSNGIVKAVVSLIAVAVISITAHVTLQEATVTSTGLPNIPDSTAIVNLTNTCDHIYEPSRAHFNHAIYISSGYRSKAVNKAVGGHLNSQHLSGEAIDLDADKWGGLTNRELFKFIRDSLDYDQLIMEGGSNGWVHASYRKDKNRKQAFYIQ